MIPTTPDPPITPITDRRPILRGIIPRSTQTWLLGGGAMLLGVVVIIFGGNNDVKKQAAAALAPPVTPADPERLQHYEAQLRQAPVAQPVMPSAATLTQAAYDPQAPAAVTPYVDTPSGYVVEQPKPADPIAEDRRRREYESLFSSNVVSSRRPASDTLAANVAGPQPVQPPSLDDVTRSVLKQMAPPLDKTAAVSQELAEVGRQANPNIAAARQSLTPAAGLHRVYEGTVIDAILANRLDGSGIAPVRALVTNDVYSQDLTRVIPAGATVLGTASPVSGFGQSRLAVAFHRIIGPNGLDISLDQFVGLNIAGDAGLKDKVDNHLISIFGASAAVGLISGLSQAIGGSFGRDNTTIVVGGAGDATAQSAARVMDRFLNRPPTITIREGHRLRVYLTSDLDLNAYGEER